MSSSISTTYTAGPSFRNPVSSYDNTKDSSRADTPLSSQLQAISPNLKIYTRSSTSFSGIRAVHVLNHSSQPLLICRPTTVAEVSQIISFCVSSKTQFTVRAGGHDDSGRSCVQDSLVIDVRELDSITLNEDRTSVTVGAGTLSDNLRRFLDSHGLMATTGVCKSVGIVNWAAVGGYGPFNGSFGLGVDQILAARLVDANGQIVDADTETLWGIRGGGGNFGVIVNLTVKVYPTPSILAGMISFPISEARQVLEKYQVVLDEEHPDAWGGGLAILRVPGHGIVVNFFASWSSMDFEKGEKFLNRIRSLGSVLFDTVSKTTASEYLHTVGSLVAETSFSHVQSCHVDQLSTAVIDIIIERAAELPENTTCMINLHSCHGKGAQPDPTACFGKRSQHILVEIIGTTSLETNQDEAYAWATNTHLEFKQRGVATKGGYPNLMRPEESVKDCFSNSWDRLKALKMKLDRDNVFSNAVPSLV